MSKRITGFTIVEILVVFAILGLLSALLLPAFTSARQKGRDTTCLSNLHQLGLATSLYCEDYDGRYPYALNPGSHDEVIIPLLPTEIDKISDYPLVLQPYVKTPSIFYCPTDVLTTLEGKKKGRFEGAFARFGTSYLYNDSLGVSMSDYQIQTSNSSVFPLYNDWGTWHGMVVNSEYDNFKQVIFIDLHVKRIRLQQMMDQKVALLN